MVVVVVEELDPPQPTLKAMADTNITLRPRADHMPRRVNFLRRKKSGNRSNGSRINDDEPETVSLNTTVT